MPEALDAAISSPDLTKRRILVVESDVLIANELTRLMSEMGHEVQLSADAKSALFGLMEFEPHLVLLGTYLADMPGYELSSILRGAPQYSQRFRHVGLLYVADRHKLLKYRFIGAPEVPISQYIFKPIDSDEVHDKVTRALRASVVG
jgi:PleD family two-component response regulator